MFVVLGLLISVDQLTLNAVQLITPELQSTFHVSKGTAIFIGTASGLFYVLGAVPLGWLADRMRRVPIVGSDRPPRRRLHDARRRLVERLHVVLVHLLRRRDAKANNIAVHPSLLADNYPIGIRARIFGVHEPRPAGARQLQPAPGRAHRDVRQPPLRRHRGLALVLRRARPPRRARGRARVLHQGATAGPVREGRRARRGRRGRAPRPAVDGGGVHAARRRSRRSERRSPRSRPWASGSSHSGACSPSTSTTRSAYTTSSGAASILSLAGWVAVPFLYPVGAYFDRTYRKDPAQGARHRRRAHPAVRVVHAAAGVDAQHGVVRHLRHPAGRAHRVRVRHGDAGAAPRCARTGCAVSAPRWASCTSSSSAASRAGSSPTSSPTSSGCAAPCSSSGSRPASSAASC